jgi:hypothetical protein
MNQTKPLIHLFPAVPALPAFLASLACFLFVSLFLCSPQSNAASHTPPTKKGDVPAALVGTWHTESIDGDCLFLIIREFRVTLHADSRFVASVRLRDDSTESMSGTFQVLPDKTLAFHATDKKQHTRIQYRLEDKGLKLKVKDPKFGVTVEMKKLQPAP